MYIHNPTGHNKISYLDGSKLSRLALESAQPPIHWVLYSFPGLKRPVHETEHSPPSTVEVKNEWNYTSTPPVCLMARTVTRLVFMFMLTNSEYSTECHSVEVHTGGTVWCGLFCGREVRTECQLIFYRVFLLSQHLETAHT